MCHPLLAGHPEGQLVGAPTGKEAVQWGMATGGFLLGLRMRGAKIQAAVRCSGHALPPIAPCTKVTRPAWCT